MTTCVMNTIMQIPQPLYDSPVTGDKNRNYFIDFTEDLDKLKMKST